MFYPFFVNLQHLQLTCEEITHEEKEQITTNASLPDKNREIADVPGMLLSKSMVH